MIVWRRLTVITFQSIPVNMIDGRTAAPTTATPTTNPMPIGHTAPPHSVSAERRPRTRCACVIAEADPAPDDAADGGGRREQRELESPTCPSTSWPYRTKTAVAMVPSRLRAPSAMAQVRSRSWCHSQRKPSRELGLERLTLDGGSPGGRGAASSPRSAKTSRGRQRRTTPASNRTGRTKPTASRRLAERRSERTGWRRARPRTSGRWPARGARLSTIAGRNVWALLS